jgi:rabenosyn-5
VPYQAYRVRLLLCSRLSSSNRSKSKRHSRTVSSIHLSPNVSPPPISRSSSIVSTAPPIPAPTFARPQEYYESEKVVAVSTEYQTAVTVDTGKTRTPSLDPPSKDLPSSPTVNGSSASSGTPSPARTDVALPDHVQVSILNEEPVPRANGKEKEFDVLSLSLATSPPSIAKPLPASPKPSKFRRLRPPPATSPLRPPGARSPALSASSVRQLDGPHAPAVHTRVTSVTSVTSANSENGKLLPPASLKRESVLVSQSGTIQRSSSVVPPQLPPKLYSPVPAPAPALRSSTSTSASASASAPTSTLVSPAASTPSLPSTSSAPASSSTRTRAFTPTRSPAPYRPGFQPKGVYRPRTDEFSEFRKKRADEGRIEKTKLERRLEKLIALHFPVENPADKSVDAKKAEGSVNGRGRGLEKRRASSFFNIDFKNMDAGGLWKGVLQSQMVQGSKNDIRGMHAFILFH